MDDDEERRGRAQMKLFGWQIGKKASESKPPSHGVLDRNTILRFLESLRPIRRLTYFGPDDRGIVRVLSRQADSPDIPPEGVTWQSYHPLIIPAAEIHSFSDFQNQDMQCWVLRGHQISRVLNIEQLNNFLNIVFDFQVRRPDKALNFGFHYKYDTDWLRFMV